MSGEVPEWKKKLYAVRHEELPASKPAAAPSLEQPRVSPSGQQESYEDASPLSGPPKPKRENSQGARADGKAGPSGKTRERTEPVSSKALQGGRKDGRVSQGVEGTAYERFSTSDGGPGGATLNRNTSTSSRTTKGGAGKSEAGTGSKGGRAGGRTEAVARGGGRRTLRDPRQALAPFQEEGFDLESYIGRAYQDVDEKGVAAASQELLSLRDQCHKQVQSVVLDNHQLFLECCKGRALLDEAVTELRGHVQDTTSLVGALKEARQVTQQHAAALADNPTASFIIAAPALSRALGSSGAGGSASGGAAAPGGSRSAAQPRPVADAVEAQLRSVLLQLDVAVAEREYGTAVSLLGLAADALALVTRDAHVIAKEVGDVSNWRQGWEVAVAQHHRTLVSGLESHLSRGGTSLSAVEMRGAAAALAALAGDVHATNTLLACHSERLGAVQSLLLRYHMSASTGSEEDAQQFAAALCQRAFLGIGAAADDVAAVWGRSTAPAAALLARWAEREARAAARAVRRQALTPYVDGASLSSTVMCIQVGLVVCGTLEMSHALSLTAPYMAELWFHLEEVMQRNLKALAEEMQASAQKEVALMLQQQQQQQTSGEAQTHTTNNHSRPSSAVLRRGCKEAPGLDVELKCCGSLIARLSHISRITVPFAGPRMAAVARPGLLAVMAALLDGVASALQEAASDVCAEAVHVARVGQAVMAHLQAMMGEEGPLAQALAPVTPACGLLLDLGELREAVAGSSRALGAGVAAQQAAAAQALSLAKQQTMAPASAAPQSRGTGSGRGGRGERYRQGVAAVQEESEGEVSEVDSGLDSAGVEDDRGNGSSAGAVAARNARDRQETGTPARTRVQAGSARDWVDSQGPSQPKYQASSGNVTDAAVGISIAGGQDTTSSRSQVAAEERASVRVTARPRRSSVEEKPAESLTRVAGTTARNTFTSPTDKQAGRSPADGAGLTRQGVTPREPDRHGSPEITAPTAAVRGDAGRTNSTRAGGRAAYKRSDDDDSEGVSVVGTDARGGKAAVVVAAAAARRARLAALAARGDSSGDEGLGVSSGGAAAALAVQRQRAGTAGAALLVQSPSPQQQQDTLTRSQAAQQPVPSSTRGSSRPQPQQGETPASRRVTDQQQQRVASPESEPEETPWVAPPRSRQHVRHPMGVSSDQEGRGPPMQEQHRTAGRAATQQLERFDGKKEGRSGADAQEAMHRTRPFPAAPTENKPSVASPPSNNAQRLRQLPTASPEHSASDDDLPAPVPTTRPRPRVSTAPSKPSLSPQRTQLAINSHAQHLDSEKDVPRARGQAGATQAQHGVSSQPPSNPVRPESMQATTRAGNGASNPAAAVSTSRAAMLMEKRRALAASSDEDVPLHAEREGRQLATAQHQSLAPPAVQVGLKGGARARLVARNDTAGGISSEESEDHNVASKRPLARLQQAQAGAGSNGKGSAGTRAPAVNASPTRPKRVVAGAGTQGVVTSQGDGDATSGTTVAVGTREADGPGAATIRSREAGTSQIQAGAGRRSTLARLRAKAMDSDDDNLV